MLLCVQLFFGFQLDHARAKPSPMSARWNGGQVTMGPAGRDRRVRSVPKRQAGARDEDSPAEAAPSSASAPCKRPASRLQEHFTGKSSQHPVRQYTDPRQESPERKRGRQATLSRPALWARYSLGSILSAGTKELLEMCLELHLLQDGRLDACDWWGIPMAD